MNLSVIGQSCCQQGNPPWQMSQVCVWDGRLTSRGATQPSMTASLPRIALPSGGRVYHPLDLRDFVGWKPAQLGMFVDDFFVLGQIDTKGLVRCDV